MDAHPGKDWTTARLSSGFPFDLASFFNCKVFELLDKDLTAAKANSSRLLPLNLDVTSAFLPSARLEV